MARKRNPEKPPGGPEGLQNLDAKRVAALGLLLQGETPPATARALGVSRITVWRWVRKDPEFAAVLAELQTDLTEDVQKGLRNLSRAAMDKLSELLDSEDGRVALGAANSILDRVGVDGKKRDSTAEDWLRDIFGDELDASRAEDGDAA